MSAHLWLWFSVVAVGSARVVRQPDGIISIITELEPENAPVTYLQGVDAAAERRSPVIVEDSPSPPLAEGEFRVRSTKIRVVNPETGFKTVHDGSVAQDRGASQNKNIVNAREESEPRNEIRAEPANDFNVVYPSRSRNSIDFNDDPESYLGNRDFRDNYQRRRKPGKYGHQTPKRDNMVRTEKTTRVRDNDGPPQVFKETIVRPATDQDEIKIDINKKKSGKPGRFVRYRSQNPTLDIDDSNTHVKQRSQSRSSNNDKVGQYGRYRSQQQDTINDSPRRFRTSQRNIPNPVPAVGEVVDESNAGSELSRTNIPRKSKKEYSTSTVVRFPDGYAKDDEKRVESSSNYKTASGSRNNYRTPTVILPNDKADRKFDGKQIYGSSVKDEPVKGIVEIDQPVPQETSFVGSGVDDGALADDGVIYAGGGYDDGVGVGVVGIGGGYGDGYEKDQHFEKDKGKHYTAGHHASHGAKGQKGYNNEESFSKGKSEKHGHDENKGYSKENEGEKKSHLDQSSQFAAGHQASEGGKESDFHREKGHRKGHKKSGFRTVSHKDEYNKKEEFFDEEHDVGGIHKEGHKKEEHSDKHGGKDKKAYLDAGHHHATRGHEGGHENGHGFNQHKGHHKEKGHSGHYGQEEEYGKKAGHKEGEVHGHSEYGGAYHG